MARMRVIKPEFWTSEQVMELSPLARLAFVGMWNFCDDAGIHPAKIRTLKAEIFPADSIEISDVEGFIKELIQQKLLYEYSFGDEKYWQVTGWHHQKIDQPTFKYPRPDGKVPEGAAKRRAENPLKSMESAECSANTRRTLGEHSANTRLDLDECSPPERKGKERKGIGKETTTTKTAPPAAQRGTRFCATEYLTGHGVSVGVIADWLDLRKIKKSPPSETAIKRIMTEANKANITLEAALETCCSRGWIGFNADWVKGNAPAATQQTQYKTVSDKRREAYLQLTGKTENAQPTERDITPLPLPLLTDSGDRPPF